MKVSRTSVPYLSTAGQPCWLLERGEKKKWQKWEWEINPELCRRRCALRPFSPLLLFWSTDSVLLSTLFQFGWWLLLSWTTIDRKLYKIWFEQHYRLRHSPRQNGQDLYLRVGVYPARLWQCDSIICFAVSTSELWSLRYSMAAPCESLFVSHPLSWLCDPLRWLSNVHVSVSERWTNGPSGSRIETTVHVLVWNSLPVIYRINPNLTFFNCALQLFFDNCCWKLG